MSGRSIVGGKMIVNRMSGRQFACVMSLQAAAGMRVQRLVRALVRVETMLRALA
jgi:hypothetical protein